MNKLPFVFVIALIACAAPLWHAGRAIAQNLNPETLEPEPPATAPAGARSPTTRPQSPPSPQSPSPSLQMTKEDPSLPRVLLIGDSISQGYTLRTRQRLSGKANVQRALTNCGATTRGLAYIDGWLGADNTGGEPKRKWDVIHFNFGLHDLKYVDDRGRTVAPSAGGHQNVSPADYEANLRTLIAKMKSTGATLVFATTTPVPDGLPGHLPDQVTKYNEIALRVMKDEGIAIDDLYSLAKPRLSEIQLEKNVHFRGSGSDLLAEQVAASIEKALAGRKPADPQQDKH